MTLMFNAYIFGSCACAGAFLNESVLSITNVVRDKAAAKQVTGMLKGNNALPAFRFH